MVQKKLNFKNTSKKKFNKVKVFGKKKKFNKVKVFKKGILNRYLFKKFLNKVMRRGKKKKARKILLKVFLRIQLIFKCNAFILLHNVIKKIYPVVETISIKKRGHLTGYSCILSKKRQEFLAINWLLTVARKNKNLLCFEDKLTYEIFNILRGVSVVLDFKKQTVKDLKKNKTLIHYRWKKTY